MLNLGRLFWRPDPRGHRIRVHAQEICWQAMNDGHWLDSEEQFLIVRARGCFPQDAVSFCMLFHMVQLCHTIIGYSDVVSLQGDR